MVDIYRPSPLMPGGLAMMPMAGGPLAGGGINFPIWPELIDSFEPFTPIIVTAADLDTFEGCADLIIPCDRWRVVLPRETRTQIMRRR